MIDQHDELRDKADLFEMSCHMVSAGPLYDWWEAVDPLTLPHGGRSPETPAEAAMFLRHTREMAIQAGLWKRL